MITHFLHGISREKIEMFWTFVRFFHQILGHRRKGGLVAQLRLKSKNVVYNEFVLSIDREIYHHFLLFFFSFLFSKGFWIFCWLQVPETRKFGGQVKGWFTLWLVQLENIEQGSRELLFRWSRQISSSWRKNAESSSVLVPAVDIFFFFSFLYE